MICTGYHVARCGCDAINFETEPGIRKEREAGPNLKPRREVHERTVKLQPEERNSDHIKKETCIKIKKIKNMQEMM